MRLVGAHHERVYFATIPDEDSISELSGEHSDFHPAEPIVLARVLLRGRGCKNTDEPFFPVFFLTLQSQQQQEQSLVAPHASNNIWHNDG